MNIDKITIKSYLKIDQSLYEAGEEVEKKAEWISHEILIKPKLGREEC